MIIWNGMDLIGLGVVVVWLLILLAAWIRSKLRRKK